MSVRLSSADRRWQKAVAVVRSVFFTAAYAERGERVGEKESGCRGLTPRRSGRGWPDRTGKVAEEDGVGAGTGEGDAHPAGGLRDAGNHPFGRTPNGLLVKMLGHEYSCRLHIA